MPAPTRIWNPPNPYLSEHRELLGEPPVAALEVYEDESKSILSRNDSPHLGFRWMIGDHFSIGTNVGVEIPVSATTVGSTDATQTGLTAPLIQSFEANLTSKVQPYVAMVYPNITILELGFKF